MSSPKKEPIKNVKLWIVFGIIIILSTPWYMPAGSFQPLFFGIPYWALIMIIVSLVLSAFITYVIKFHWNIVEDDERTKGEE